MTQKDMSELESVLKDTVKVMREIKSNASLNFLFLKF